MKRLILLIALIFISLASFPQKIQKGNLLGIHVFDNLKLNTGVTSEQVEIFFLNKYIPEFQKHFKKLKIIPLKGIRGEHPNELGLIIILKNEKDRGIYWNEDGTFNEKSQTILKKMQPLFDELNSLGTSTDIYTDWLVK